MIIEERAIWHGQDLRRNAEIMGYQRWVQSDHPDLWEQLYRRPFNLENYIRLPETIPIHAQLVAEYLASH